MALAVATAALFWPIVGHGFLNWDDPDVVAANPRLHQPLAALLAWAFSTREMGHYQPLSWLALAAVAGEPASPARVHGLAVALHAINAGLLMWLIARALDRGDGDRRRWGPALAGAALFALHPLRVEPVAWASALPYLISYAPLLVAVGAWIAWLRRGSTAWLATSVGLFAVSQLARVTAPLLPIGLALLALVVPARRALPARTIALALVPFVVIGVPLAVIEAGARDPAPLGEVGLGLRLAWTLIHPALYAWRTLTGRMPTPVETIPRAPEADWTLALVALAASAAAGLAAWRLWSARAAVVLWGSYLALLAPVVGVLPSGLQVTASRYAYGPAMVLSAALAAAIAAAPAHRRRVVLAGVALLVAVQAAAVRPAASYWRDSVTLWTATTAGSPDDDVARYNLALALLDAGQTDRAVDELQQLVTRVPDHDLGRARLDGLLADRAQREGDAAATAGRLDDAVDAYTRVIERDPTRSRPRLNRGMALAQLGDLQRAAPDLEAGGAAASGDPAAAGALALAWSQGGRDADAITLLLAARRRVPGDPGVAMNLARLLLTATPTSLRDPAAALEIAAGVNDVTGGRDPRVLATLAEALAATGQPREAARAWDAAIGAATESGDPALAADLRLRRTQPTR